MSLKTHYENLPDPKKKLLNDIMQACDLSQASVYRLLTGKKDPTKLQAEAISKITGITVEELFPDMNKKKTKKEAQNV
ncbi:hypothetical protein JGH11_10550 [Dysgonomonas sp. Marseille-P4677]|uniref:hypothetical protein n=1 Tax=Dysgonomonas sp. Marseille-P4677 TaxID=2364790 RepID=UPI00191363BD|nr:hypothetical protein [Dysgonomonas sp. Marseille-P4677]MBK5721311.1 hypothetical protein [Dysgonomonas sp. Marseille-P4677]